MPQKVVNLLTIDIGNTNTVVGLFQHGKLLQSWRLTTVRDRTSDEHGILIKSLLSLSKYEDLEFDGIAVSSVVPPLLPSIKEMSTKYFSREAFVVQPGIRTGMPILIEHPQEVGADRIVHSVAGFHKYGGPCIVIDFGTATTFDAVSAKGEYLGGIIAPGIMISAEALFQRAAKLPRVEIREPDEIIGRSTVGAMQSGLFYGYLGLIEKILTLMQKELGDNVVTIATGGLSSLFAPRTSKIKHTDQDLILNGLQILFEMNP
jgi:type III pantothenate kinase